MYILCIILYIVLRLRKSPCIVIITIMIIIIIIITQPLHKKACYGPAVVESSVAQGFTDRRKVMTPANEEIILTMVNLYGLR